MEGIPDIQSLRRDKLTRLWKTVTDDNDFTRTLEQDTVIPSSFLDKNGIILLDYDIEKTDTTHDSPVLFRPAPLEFFKRYPIDLNGFETPKERDIYMDYRKYNPADGNENVPKKWWPKEFVGAVASYLEDWATGTFPRQLPDGVGPHLPDDYGIKKPDHPGGLYAGEGFYGRGWAADVFEYKEKPDGSPYPHVMMLSCQRNRGHNKTIMRGELAVILTAMRNRAFQKVEEDDDDEEYTDDEDTDDEEDTDDDDAEFEEFDEFDDEEEEEEDDSEDENNVPKLLFENEERFPVLVISYVGPQHARILYAYMEGLRLVIRQSPIYSFEGRNIDALDMFSTYYLSRPVEGVPMEARRRTH